MGLLNQIGLSNPGLVFSQIDRENLLKRQALAQEQRWKEQQALQREQQAALAPMRALQAKMLEQQMQDYRTPEQKQAAEIEAYRRKQEIEQMFRRPEKPQLVVSNDEYGNPRFFMYDANGIRQVGGPGGSAGVQQPQSTSGTTVQPQPQPDQGQQQAQSVSLKQPSPMDQGMSIQTRGGLLSGFLNAPVPQIPSPGVAGAYRSQTSSPARNDAQAQGQSPAGARIQVGQTYDASGATVAAPGMARYENPQDMRMPDGSLKSVQWDKLGRFYRVLGPSVAVDKAGNLGAAKEQQKNSAGIVLEDIGRAKRLAKDYSVIPNTGWGLSVWSKDLPGTARDLDKTLNTIRSNVGFDKLQQMRAASPTGGALGQVSNFENEMLQSVMGSLEQSQSEKEFLYNLNRLEDEYLNIVHGPGNWTRSANGGVALKGGSPSGTLRYNPKTGRFE